MVASSSIGVAGALKVYFPLPGERAGDVSKLHQGLLNQAARKVTKIRVCCSAWGLRFSRCGPASAPGFAARSPGAAGLGSLRPAPGSAGSPLGPAASGRLRPVPARAGPPLSNCHPPSSH